MAPIKETINKFKDAFLSKFSLPTQVDTLWEELKLMCLLNLTYSMYPPRAVELEQSNPGSLHIYVK